MREIVSAGIQSVRENLRHLEIVHPETQVGGKTHDRIGVRDHVQVFSGHGYSGSYYPKAQEGKVTEGPESKYAELRQKSDTSVNVRAKIIEALNRSSGRADAAMPNGGKPEVLRAIFIKSNEDISSKLSILEESSFNESIQKSAPLESSAETTDITMSALVEFSPNNYPEDVKSPIATRKLHSWFSYFYSASGKSSENASPTREAIFSPETSDSDHGPFTFEDPLIRSEKPPKGILKKAKELGDISGIPPPIQKSGFLRQEEVIRLTKFSEKFRSGAPAQTGIEKPSQQGDQEQKIGARRNAIQVRQRTIRFDMERITVQETFSPYDYERGGVEYIAKSLTPEIAMMIKRELNEVKREMVVHEDSKGNTQFYQLR